MTGRTTLIVTALAAVATVAHSPVRADIEIDGERYHVVDMHLHPGQLGRFPEAGRTFVIESMPPFVQLYAPALANAVSDPWTEHLGIRAQTEMAGVDRGVLFAVYAPHSAGYYTNRELEAVLDDPRNRVDSGEPWAWGMASISFEGYLEPGVDEARLTALSSYFEQRPDLFIGIKLAHAHQQVPFDDERYLGVYDVAARHEVPVLLHTGFSPFPGTQTDPAYYDPRGLVAVIEAYDGAHGMGRVDFVLSHVGQGDARAVDSALDLAESHDNVWLEVSALSRALLLDEAGEPADDDAPQLPWVMERIRDRGLTDRALFASDGPQYSGKVRSYLRQVVDAAVTAGWTRAELRSLLSESFYRLYFASE